MGTLRQTLAYLILGQKGGENRINIIDLLKDRPYNLNQMSEILRLNYRTIKHHINVLLKNELINTSHTGSYGEVYFLSPEMEGNLNVFDEVVNKFNSSNKLRNFTYSPKFFKNVIEQTREAIIIVNEKNQIFFCNESAERLLGFVKEEIIGENIHTLSDLAIFKNLINNVKDGSTIAEHETKLIHHYKNPIYLSVTIDRIMDDNENLIGFSIICHDITDKKLAEEALKLSEERYALAQYAANIGSWDWDIKTGNLVWSDTIEPMFGFEKGRFGKTYEAFLACVHPEDRDFVINSVNACVEDGEDYNIEHRIIWPNGNVRTVSETGNVIRDENGEPVRMLGIVQDMTERKKNTEYQELTIKLLTRLNKGGDGKTLIEDILIMIKEFTNFDAVAIRLKHGPDYPYYVYKGFSEQFIKSENYLCSRDKYGELIIDQNGHPHLECMCGNVLQNRTDSTKPFFTNGGSFWTNSTTELLATTTEKDRLGRTRNRCNIDGYETVALIPLTAENEVIGLLQLNNKEKNKLTLDNIEFYENIGKSIGIAFSRIK